MKDNFENEIKTLGIDIENAALEDAPSEGIDISNIDGELAIEPPKKKRKPIGGIIAGIFNIIFNAIFTLVSAIPFGIYSYFVGVGYYSIYELNHMTTEGFESLGPALAIALVLVYGAIFGGAYLVTSIHSIILSIIYFIAARFNRSKFFKISTAIICALHALGWMLVIFTYVIFFLGVKFGWFI